MTRGRQIGIAGAAVLAIAWALASGAVPEPSLPAAAPRDGEWRFRVLLDGQPIGSHRFVVQGSGEDRTVRSEADLAVTILGFNAFRYRHRAVERWHGDCLTALSSTTDKDGTHTAVDAERVGPSLTIRATSGTESLEGCLMSFAYWNPAIQTQSRLINSQTGQVEPVRISHLGAGSLEVRGRPVAAMRLRIAAASAPIDVWYSAAGDWIGLDSMIEGTRKLSYRLE